MKTQITPIKLNREVEIERLVNYWYSLEDEGTYQRSILDAEGIRSIILDFSQVAVRKTSGLHDVGCTVDCNYCTLGEQYAGKSNRNKIAEWASARAHAFLSKNPNSNIELVGYWPGINTNGTEFDKLVKIISELHKDFPEAVIGGDLGIISDERVMVTLRDTGLSYIHNNLETTARLYPLMIGRKTNRLEDKIKTIKLAQKVGLPTSSGLLIGLGEQPEDLAELTYTLRELEVQRVAANFMDYSNPRIAERYAGVKDDLTPEYAFRVLAFLRNHIKPNQSLVLGSGVRNYFYRDDHAEQFMAALKIVDMVHIGSFINLQEAPQYTECDQRSMERLTGKLKALGYVIVAPRKLNFRCFKWRQLK